MDWADDIAYSIHDIEDALSTGFMKRSDLENADLHHRVHQYVQLKQPRLGISREEVTGVLSKLAFRMKNNLMFVPRGQTKQVLGMYVNEFVTKSRLRTQVSSPQSPADFHLHVPSTTRNRCEILKALTMTLVVDDARTIVNRYQAKTIIRDIFDMYMENCMPSDRRSSSRGKLLPEAKRPILAHLDHDEKRIARFVADHIASLTDAQMQRLHSRVFGNTPASPYEPLIG
jgi:dGTPase